MKKMVLSTIIIGLLLTSSIATVNADVYHDEEQSESCGSPISYGDEDDEIALMFSFDSPVITEINRDGGTYAQVVIEGLSIIGDIGVPLLPVKPVNVLLPQRAAVESIAVTKGDAVVLGDEYNVELGAEPVIMAAVPYDESDETTIRFDPMVSYPDVDFENVGTYDFRGYRVLTLIVYPVHYIGENGEIYYYDEMTLTIRTTEIDSVSPLFRGSPKDEMMMREMVDDYSCSNTYLVVDQEVFSKSLAISGDSYEYIIITNETLKNAAGEYTFQDLVQYKNDNGVSAKIVTLEDIYDNYEGEDEPEKIRNFITYAYLNWGTEYVLLGGDVDVVPARWLWVVSNPAFIDKSTREAHVISDLYYGCLDGTFNSDGDTLWGEPDDGPNGEDVDLVGEVYVGRACVGNESEVSNFVMKTLAYEQTPIDDPCLRKALMVGSYLGFGGIAEYGGNYLDEMIDGSDTHGYSTVGIPSGEYEIDKLYDRDWAGNNWHTNDLVTRINAGVNVINHLGHGESDGWVGEWEYKMENEDVFLLENTRYSFIYSQACLVGSFYDYDPDCFAEYLTVKTGHGAFAAIMNSHFGWGRFDSTDGPSQRFAREFFDSIFNEGVRDPIKTRLGVANQDSKEDNLWRINEPCMRWCYYELNLFGDPQVSLKPVPVPDHDIAVDSIELSENINPDEDFDIIVTIVNQGLNDETDISGKISIMEIPNMWYFEENLVYEYLWNIDSLDQGDEATIGFTYSLPRSLYRIRAHVNPVPEEDIVLNNNMTIGIFIGDNNPPEKPAKPSGPKVVRVGKEYTYSTSTVDPEGDQIYYQWGWGCDEFGNCDYSGWIGPYDSGEIVTMSHTWYEAGFRFVEVRAKDVYIALGDWSDLLLITVLKNKQSCEQSTTTTTAATAVTTTTSTASTTSGQSSQSGQNIR